MKRADRTVAGLLNVKMKGSLYRLGGTCAVPQPCGNVVRIDYGRYITGAADYQM